jgi:hypothetical protein
MESSVFKTFKISHTSLLFQFVIFLYKISIKFLSGFISLFFVSYQLINYYEIVELFSRGIFSWNFGFIGVGSFLRDILWC